MAIARNALCPCGSGKKYKRCCFGKIDRRDKRKMMVVVGVLAAVGIAAASYVAWESTPRNAFFTVLLTALVIGGYLVLRSPPGSTGGRGGDGIDFGR